MSAKQAENSPLSRISLSSNRKWLPRSTPSRKRPPKQSPLSKSRQIVGDENAPPLDTNIQVADLRNSPQKWRSKPLNSLQETFSEQSNAVPASPDPAVQMIARIRPPSARGAWTVRKLSEDTFSIGGRNFSFDSVLDSNSKQKDVLIESCEGNISPRSVLIDSSRESSVLEDPVLSDSPKISNLLRKRTSPSILLSRNQRTSNSELVDASSLSSSRILSGPSESLAARLRSCLEIIDHHQMNLGENASVQDRLNTKISTDREKELENVCNDQATRIAELTSLVEKLRQEKENLTVPKEGNNRFDLREKEELLNEIQTLRSQLEETDYALRRSVLGNARFVEHYVELQEKYNDLAEKQEL